MARVVLTDSADANSTVIYDDLNVAAGKRTAQKYRGLFKRLYEHLAAFPDSGAPRPKIGPDIRIGVVAPYIIIYRHSESDNAVVVLRIVHGRRKITGQMLRRR